MAEGCPHASGFGNFGGKYRKAECFLKEKESTAAFVHKRRQRGENRHDTGLHGSSGKGLPSRHERRRCKDFGDRVALVQGLGFRVPKV